MSKPKAELDRRGRPGPVPELVTDELGSAFLGRLAHDLRGPLSPLQTAAYLLRREDIGPQRQRDLLDIIDRQATRMGAMLQEMSDWMRARSGNIGARREPVNVPMLVELACAEMAASGGVIAIPEALDEAEVLGDTQHLVQMLRTLVSYLQTRAGTQPLSVGAALEHGVLVITIEAAISSDVDGDGWQQSLGALFAAPEPAPFDEGLGLRLLIARAIAEAHGGDVTAVAPAPGHGRIVIRLPAG